MNLDIIIFVFSAVVALFGATMMIAQRNPVASVLYLVLSLVAQAVLYVQLGALFLGAILIVVYAGAIMVLFLFVIMLLNLRGGEDLGEEPPMMSQFGKYLLGALFLVELLFVVISGQSVLSSAPIQGAGFAESTMEFGTLRTVAIQLFRKYLYPFELTGVLMLIAIVGAVVIAKRGGGESDDQHTETNYLTEGEGD